MKVEILDMQKLISVNKIQEVTSPRMISNKMMFDPNGIMSNEIFGISKSDRRGTFGYINLRRPFIHPHIYQKVLKSIFRNITYLVAGQKRFVVKNGLLVEDPDNGWTGLSALYDHWDEIKWSEFKSSNKTSKQVLSNLTRDQVFVKTWPVCPPSYRDIMLAGAMDASDHTSEVNNLYVSLIRMVGIISEGGLFSRTQYGTHLKIQNTLVEIYDYFKNQISKKQGLIRKYLIGKSVDFGTRAVISAPSYRNERLVDNIIDVEHTAVPISMCCSTFYPFIEAWLRNFFTREIINDPNMITYYDQETGREFTASLREPEIQFSEKNIRKMINDYCLNPDNRFRLIQVDVDIPGKKVNTVKATMILKGKSMMDNNSTVQIKRGLTITDVLYLACVDVCEKRHCMVSRYPVGTDKGIYFNKIRVQSTVNHIHLVFNGKEYPFYPDIDFNIPQERVGVQFIDTLVLSNSHLDGMGADYLLKVMIC